MQATAGAAGSKFTLPVASKGLQNWAAVIGRMCTAANQDSTACLNEYFNRTNGMLDGLAGKYDGLKGNETLAAVRHDFPKLDVKKPTFFSGSNDVVSSNVAAVQLGLTGMSFSACAVPISPVGVNVGPTGISIGPTVISISATGANVQPQGLNISPNLIVVGPYDTSVSGQGLNIAPALIAVSPTKTVINPVGPLKISDAKVSKTVPALPGPDNDSGPDNNTKV
ncbi:g415 [Coccomyxa viridis]|uniref:G415 protein n=1 Tax=Coccomyxa viridis TaxID=1274662 RepID=A0ABP1FJP7_9CHLO